MKNILAALPLAFISLSDISNLNSQTVTVSGLSSGAMMAAQMLVAESATIKGAGLVGGGPYSCSKGSLTEAFQCIEKPETIQIEQIFKLTSQLEKENKIDSLKNLKNHDLFILNTTQDHVVLPAAGFKSFEYFKKYIALENIKAEFNLTGGHSFPTLSSGNACDYEGSPWVNNCGYDAAKNILEKLTHKNLIAGIQKYENLYTVNLNLNLEAGSSLNALGYVYVPPACLKKSKKSISCDLHVVFHGCRQTLDEAGAEFITLAGYNDWAENNNIVILYPNVIKSFFNPKGCWDWWGYTGANYNTKDAPQIRSLMSLIKTLTKKKNL